MSDTKKAVSLPGGTEIGYIEESAASPGTFDGWVKMPNGSHVMTSEGVSEDRAMLFILQPYLVREVGLQTQPFEPGHAERHRRIREGFLMKRTLTAKIVRREGGAAG